MSILADLKVLQRWSVLANATRWSLADVNASCVSLPYSWAGVFCNSKHTRVGQLYVNVTTSISSSTFPDSFLSELGGLVSITINGAQIRGALPQANLTTNPALRFVDFSKNFLVGSIPLSWSTLNLSVLQLSHNQLDGVLPNLTHVNVVDVSCNFFTGDSSLLLGSPCESCCSRPASNQCYHCFGVANADGIEFVSGIVVGIVLILLVCICLLVYFLWPLCVRFRQSLNQIHFQLPFLRPEEESRADALALAGTEFAVSNHRVLDKNALICRLSGALQTDIAGDHLTGNIKLCDEVWTIANEYCQALSYSLRECLSQPRSAVKRVSEQWKERGVLYRRMLSFG